MTTDADGQHFKQVDAWIAKNATGLAPDRLILLFGEAILAIRTRTLVTLSEVTFDAIFDRVLVTSQRKHSLLAHLKCAPDLSLNTLVAQANDWTVAEIQEAFRFFLVELLALLGKLTADILTKPLHRELSKVTSERIRALPKLGQRGLRSVKSGSEEEDS